MKSILTAYSAAAVKGAAVVILAALIGLGGVVPGHAANWGLTLFVLANPPVSASTGPAAYSPGSRAVTRLIFENRGEQPLENVRVEVKLVGATPVVSTADDANPWKRDGNTLRASIDALAPGASHELTLIVELADGTERGSRGTGGEARIRASVPASGETLVAEAYWPIAGCADAYYAALREVRYGEFAALRAAVDASRAVNPSMPGRMVFKYRAGGGRDEASAVKFAERIAATRGVDGYFTTQEIRWMTGRLINDIGIYLRQDRYPGLCTGVVEWTGILQQFFGRFTKRVDELEKMRLHLEPAVRQLVASADESGMDQGSGDIEAADAATLLLATVSPDPDPGDGSPGVGQPGEGVAVFISAFDALDAAGATLSRERRAVLTNTFAAIERLWYLEQALGSARAVSDGFADTLNAIRDAHQASCTCGS